MADGFVCPNCGEPISADAQFCRHCGADERTGWSDQTYLDGIDLPDPEEYEELREKEFGKKRTGSTSIGWRTIVGLLLLVVMVLFLVGNAVF
ncbi:MAG: zinc ribbon domain-containing protein [Chitinispirillaceae bacterium]